MSYFIHILELLICLLGTVIVLRVRNLMTNTDQPIELQSVVSESSVSSLDSVSDDDTIAQREQAVNDYLAHAAQLATDLTDQVVSTGLPQIAGAQTRTDTETNDAVPVDSSNIVDQINAFVDYQLVAMQGDVWTGSEQARVRRESISALFLIGAVDFLGKNKTLSEASRIELSEHALARYRNATKGSFAAAPSYDFAFADANMPVARAGAKAAKVWLKSPSMAAAFSLASYLVGTQAA